MGLELVPELGSFEKNPENLQNADYQLITNSFYQKTRNEINEKRLNALAKLAQEIDEPYLFGQYNDSLHYLKTLTLTLGSTAETRHRGIFFLRKVLPLLVCKNSLLDVGSGDGKLTRWIGNKFKQITAIDINREAISQLDKNIRRSVKLNKIQDSILQVALPGNNYDLSLLSHTLYYLQEICWLDVVNRLYDATKIGGIIAIVLSGDMHGKARLIKHFGGSVPNVDLLLENCIRVFGRQNVQGFASDEVFITNNLRAMLHIGGFMLYDASVTTTKDALIKYVNDHFKLHENYFEMTTQQKFILILKS